MIGDMVTLRDVRPPDVAVFYDIQSDPVAYAMAGFRPRDRAAHDAHWDKIRQDPDGVLRTIVEGDAVVGNIASFVHGEQRQIGYWVARPYWNRGIASRALQLFVTDVESRRPLFAYVLETNLGSVRVLEKSGFTVIGRQQVEEDEPVLDFLLRLG